MVFIFESVPQYALPILTLTRRKFSRIYIRYFIVNNWISTRF